jgi:hypothetical protein
MFYWEYCDSCILHGYTLNLCQSGIGDCCAAREESGNGTCYKREDVKLGDSAGKGSIVKFEKQNHKVSFLGFIIL